MTLNAIGLSNYASTGAKPRLSPRLLALFLGACLFPAAPAVAQDDVTDDRVSLGDVMLTPLDDLNLSRDPIPPVLVRSHADPYADAGLTDCGDIRQEIGNLDAVLGEDFDSATPARQGVSPEGVAQSVIASLIPFRGLIRQLSGANRHEWEFRQAIVAGLTRRAYLKGRGQSMGCEYPARPAPPGMFVRPENADGSEQGSGEDVPVMVSEPVVQETD